MIHSDIAKKWNVSIEMVQGINTGRYWHVSNRDYPIQERCKSINSKKGKGRTKLYCQNCGMELSSHKAQLCIDCAHKASRKVIERPNRKELKILIREQSFTNIAKKYGVSDNAIRKWCDSYDLPRQKYIIKKFSNEEWEKV